ncbi:hypothetical protein HDU79_011577 [Rhizoclosmatium sp. JEL0117]|nr:hypothetical protein HDU79_011577 [Rhizoclosmatium sp. JEL0117]
MTTPNTAPPQHDELNRVHEKYDRIESIRVLVEDLETVLDFEASQTLALSFLTEPETSSENTLVQVDESVDPLLEELKFWRAELESLEAKVVVAGRCNAGDYSEYETTDTEQASVIDLALPLEYPPPRIDKGKQRAEMIPESDIEDPEVVAELGPLAPECICCFDPVVFYRAASSSSTTYKEGLYIPQCSHIYCLICFKSYIASKVGNSSFPISCAAVGCSIEITPSIACKYLQSDALTTYETKLLEFSIVNKFFCPNKKCSAVMDLGVDKESLRILHENYPEICLTCSESVCVVCDVLWHKGMSCAQFQNLPLDERCKEDLEIHLMIKREKWTRCPKCHSPIDKVDGCNHVV